MAHEHSETTQLPSGKWVNVYGRKTKSAGKRLPQNASGVGHEEYDSVDAAVTAAKKRSSRSTPHTEGLEPLPERAKP